MTLSVLKDLRRHMDALMSKVLQHCDDQMSNIIEKVYIILQRHCVMLTYDVDGVIFTARTP